MHIFHKWSPWGNVLQARLTDGTIALTQVRWCRKCRKTEVRFV